MSAPRWYYQIWDEKSRACKEFGPITLAQLKEAALAGELGPNEAYNQLRREDEQQWHRMPWYLADLPRVIENGLRNHEQELLEGALHSFPALELVACKLPCIYPVDWEARWAECVGKSYGGKMIAPKTDPIWQRMGDQARYEDALGFAHAPLSMFGGYTAGVPHRECKRLGVMTEAEIQTQQELAPDHAHNAAKYTAWRASLAPGEWECISKELSVLRDKFSAEIREDLAKLGNSAGADFLRKAAGLEMSALENTPEDSEREAARQRAAEERNRAFTNVTDVQNRLPRLKAEYSVPLAAELMGLLTVAIEGGHLRAYPKWLGRAYRYTGEILEILGEQKQAAEYYGCALRADPQCGVAKRMRELLK